MSRFLAALLIMLEILHNYFNSLTKLSSDLYLAKFLNISVKSFFAYNSVDKYYQRKNFVHI